MKVFPLLFVFALSAVITSKAQVTVSITKPTLYKVVGDSLAVQASITSVYELDTVIASVGTRKTGLVFQGGFTGYINLSGLNEGDTLTLKVVARDKLSNADSATRRFIYDNPPVLIIEQPLNQSVARPTLPISIKCFDKDTVNVKISYRGNIIYTGKAKDSLRTVINLLAYDTTAGELLLEVTDKRNQTSSSIVNVYVNSDISLIPVYDANSQIIDFNYNKVLAAPEELDYPELGSILTGQKAFIPYRFLVEPISYLTPFGAVFGGRNVSNTGAISPLFYDWNNNVLDSFGTLNSAASIRTAGNYAIWSNGKDLFRRNLAAKTNVLISGNAGNWKNDVGPNGLVSFWDYTYNISSYLNGITTTLTTNAGNKWNTWNRTDGNYIVYQKHDPCCNGQQYALYMHDGTSETLLGNLGYTSPVPGTYWDVKNKFIAYTKLGTSGQTQVWVRDSTGVQSQLTFFGTSSLLDLLTERGDVIYTHDSKRYLRLRTGQTVAITPQGKTYFRDSSFYVAIGRSLFRLNLAQLLPVKVIKFAAVEDAEKNIITWKLDKLSELSYVDLEKSADGSAFKKVSRITDAGFFSDGSFADEHPFAVTYYRLKMVDKQGQSEYTTIAKVARKPKFDVSLYPNPVRDRISLRGHSEAETLMEIQISNSEGKLVKSITVKVGAGAFNTDLGVNSLSPGVYLLRISSNRTETSTIKFTKQ